MTTIVLGQGAAGEEAWPVEGPLTNDQLRATPVPVSGTFYPNTQPVSGTVALDAGTLAALETIQVGSLPALPAGSNQIGTVKVGSVAPVRQLGNLHTVAGRRFIATTGYVRCTLNTANEFIAVVRNPSDSGVVVVLDQAEFGATNNVRFSRYGGGSLTLNGSPTPRPVGRCDGTSSGQTPKFQIYTGGNEASQITSITGGTLRKVATMLSYETYQILQIGGTSVIQPGGIAYWLTDEVPGGGSGNYFNFIDFEWYEIDTTTWASMVTAAQAFPLF